MIDEKRKLAYWPRRRVVSMGGLRIVQGSQDGKIWHDLHMDKAGALESGIYNLGGRLEPKLGRRYTGIILHADEDYAWQYNKEKKEFTLHTNSRLTAQPKSKLSYDIFYSKSLKRGVCLGSDSGTRDNRKNGRNLTVTVSAIEYEFIKEAARSRGQRHKAFMADGAVGLAMSELYTGESLGPA